MAIALAQQGGNTGASPATLVITMGVSMTAGNLVVVAAEENDNATGPTIASTNVVFTKQNRFIGDGTHDNTTLWTGVIGAGAGTTITITPNGANLGNVAAIAAEFSGVQQVVDGTPPTPTNVASATPNVTSNTPSASGDLVVAFCGHTDATAPTATPSGWTALTRRAGNNSIEGAWEVNSGSSTQNASWTFAASKNALLQIALVLAAAASGSSQPQTGSTPIAQFIPGLPTFSPLLQTFPDSPAVQTLPDPSRFLNPLAPTFGFGLYAFQQPYFPPGSSDATVNPTIGVLLLSADASVVALAVTPSVGNLILSATASTVAAAVTPTVGNLALGAVASAPAVAVPESVGNLILGAGVSTLTITGDATVNPSIGTLTLSGGANVPLVALAPTIGNLILAAVAPALAEQVAPAVGVLTLSGPSSPAQVTLNPTIGNLALGAPTATLSLSVSPPAGVLTLSGGANTTTGGTVLSVADDEVVQWFHTFF